MTDWIQIRPDTLVLVDSDEHVRFMAENYSGIDEWCDNCDGCGLVFSGHPLVADIECSHCDGDGQRVRGRLEGHVADIWNWRDGNG